MATPVLLLTNLSTAAGAYGLSVNGNSPNAPAIGSGNSSSAAGSVGLRGLSVGGVGVLGIHTAPSGDDGGVAGNTRSTSLLAKGVYGLVTSTSPGAGSAGVRGENNGTGENGFGVWGSQNGFGWGVYGTAPRGRGVSGFSSSGDGVVGFSPSVVGVVGTSTSGDGIVGESSTGLAGHFFGDVTVTGTLTKGAGAFKIDHPLDPARKYLQHSFVESPDMMDVYNGNATTDGNGFATVKLPAWFQALNRDFRYQLTSLSGLQDVAVAKEIAHNRFTIQSEKPHARVSWQVTGIRHDAYANAHRIKVVVPKSGADAGKYLHPELYGQSKAKGIDWKSAQGNVARK